MLASDLFEWGIHTVIAHKKMNEILRAIDLALTSGAEPIAAFDADGTLWNMDLGEHFFDYQIRKKLLSDLPPDPWAYYRQEHKKDPARAFLWLAQINRGVPEAEVRRWAKAALDELVNVPIFENVREIIKHLTFLKVKTYVVTASIKWAVEPGAALFDISPENVIGVTTKVENGILTEKPAGVVTWREGKVQALLSATGQRIPFFTAGNTMGDLALLELASHIRLANCAAPPEHVNHATEQKLLAHARKHNWFIFDEQV